MKKLSLILIAAVMAIGMSSFTLATSNEEVWYYFDGPGTENDEWRQSLITVGCDGEEIPCFKPVGEEGNQPYQLFKAPNGAPYLDNN